MADSTSQPAVRTGTLPAGTPPTPPQRSLQRTQTAGVQPAAAKSAKAEPATAPAAAKAATKPAATAAATPAPKNDAPSAPSAAATTEGTTEPMTTDTAATADTTAAALKPGDIDPATGKKVRKKREPRVAKTTKVGELDLTQSELATLGGIYVNSQIAGLTPDKYIAQKKKQGFEEIMLWDRLYPPAPVAVAAEAAPAESDAEDEATA
jgi:hypothetical protein